MEAQVLRTFEEYALAQGYKASFAEDAVLLYDITNPGNDFRIKLTGNYYTVCTISVSKQDLEYTAKCLVYLLLAKFNKANSNDTHLHLNFKVDL